MVQHTMCKGFNIPWVRGLICHGSEIDNTLEKVIDIPWEGVSNNIGRVKYSMARGFNMPWVGCLIYHGYEVRYTMGAGFDILWVGVSYHG